MRNVAMTNKMKSVGEALQGFLETAVPSPLSAEERERLRLYNPTLATQIDGARLEGCSVVYRCDH